jgi:kumamolisin
LINEYLQGQNLSRLGSANPALYALFNSQQSQPAFHDVTSGNNLYYPATAGYDMASGLGSPDVANLAQDLAVNLGGTPAPTPTPTGTPTMTPTPTPSPTPTSTPAPSVSTLQNGGFENGQSPWQISSSGNYRVISSTKPHTGKYSAYLCGYTSCKDQIWQTFTVPASYNSLGLSYWWYSSTTEYFSHQCLDSLTVTIQTAVGQALQTLQHDCNNDITNSWKEKGFDLTALLAPYKGQRVTLLFSATTRATFLMATSFYIDDVALVAH